MRKNNFILFAATAVVIAGVGIAEAEAAASMPIGALTTQPIGHYEFCQRSPRECAQRTPGGGPIRLTRDLWNKILDVNNTVNVMVAPRTDMEIWGREEWWSYPTQVGDCEDYVLEKRRRLMTEGIPAGNLLITVVRQPNGDGHAVLTVSTDLGDFVLDNLEPLVLRWNETEYSYLKRQSSTDSGVWVSIRDDHSTAVGSVRK